MIPSDMAKTSASDPVTPLPARPRRCPICGKPAVVAHRPFCSARCANIDLGRWLKEGYSIPTDDQPEDAGDDSERS
jgi:uncharacterized protein